MTSRFLYMDGASIIHRLHPNTKLVALALLFAATLAFNHPAYEAGMVVVGIVLMGIAGALGNLWRSLRFFTLIFVVSSLLWIFFVRDIADPTVVWRLNPAMVERGTTAYDLVIVMIFAGLLALAVTVLSLIQIVFRDASQTKVGGWWYAAFWGLLALGAGLAYRGPGLFAQIWLWYLAVFAWFIAGTAVVMRRMRTPYALAVWIGLAAAALGLYLGIDGFLVHVHTEGTSFYWGPTISISKQALLYGPAMGLRIVAFLLFGLVFISTTSPEQLTQALRASGMGLAPSVALSLAFRLVPSFANTARTVMQAQRARGLDLDSGGPFHRFRKSLPAVVPTLGYALRSADDLTRALETRGLGAGRRRTEYRHLEQGKTDIAALAIVAAFALACIAARVTLNVGELLPRL